MPSTKPLPTEALVLLPSPGEAPRCSPFASQIGVDPGGTALAADLIITVDTPLPWPKPVFDHPQLEGLTSTFISAVGPARLLASVPSTDDHGAGIRVHTWWRDGARTRIARHRVANHADLVRLVNELQVHAPDQSPFIESAPAAELPHQALLVCTQGSHDVCCGTDGTRFANDAAAALDGVEVFRVSHTGGHRFAPTALSMPDGRMWAWLEPTDLEFVVHGVGDPGPLVSRCRGWWGAKGPAQMAERAVFELEGSSWNDLERMVDLVAKESSGHRYRVSGGGRTWDVIVAAGRAIPTIACRADGGLPAKPGTEYRVESVTQLG